jgi:hypothetical protein
LLTREALHRRGLKAIGAAFYGGPDGVFRLSRRGLVPGSPTDRPELALHEEHRLTPGDVVEAAIPLTPTAMRWHAGEQLRPRISGRSLLPGLSEDPCSPGNGTSCTPAAATRPACYCRPPPDGLLRRSRPCVGGNGHQIR